MFVLARLFACAVVALVTAIMTILALIDWQFLPALSWIVTGAWLIVLLFPIEDFHRGLYLSLLSIPATAIGIVVSFSQSDGSNIPLQNAYAEVWNELAAQQNNVDCGSNTRGALIRSDEIVTSCITQTPHDVSRLSLALHKAYYFNPGWSWLGGLFESLFGIPAQNQCAALVARLHCACPKAFVTIPRESLGLLLAHVDFSCPANPQSQRE